MLQTVIKVAITSVLVVAIAEASKRSVLLAAVLASLPLTSLLAMGWLYWETGDANKIADLSLAIFWLVLPSLILFVALPLFIRAGVGFGFSLAIAIALTAGGYALLLAILRQFGVTF
jgi:hypothetical protein